MRGPGSSLPGPRSQTNRKGDFRMPRHSSTPIPCACGCGKMRLPFDSRGRPRRFLQDHWGLPVSERFWSKVEKTSSCWLWIGACNSHGYGHLGIEGRTVPAHRMAYELLVGPIPNSLTLDHLCRNRPCVNPAHLEPVSIQVNVLRGVGISASHARKNHCKRGHVFDLLNTRFRREANGAQVRECRTCDAVRHHQRHTAKRSQ